MSQSSPGQLSPARRHAGVRERGSRESACYRRGFVPGREPVARRYRGKLRRRQAPVGKCRRSGARRPRAPGRPSTPPPPVAASAPAVSATSAAAVAGCRDAGHRRGGCGRSRHTRGTQARFRPFVRGGVDHPRRPGPRTSARNQPLCDLGALRGRRPRPLALVDRARPVCPRRHRRPSRASRQCRSERVGKMIGALIGAQSTYSTLVQTTTIGETRIITRGAVHLGAVRG